MKNFQHPEARPAASLNTAAFYFACPWRGHAVTVLALFRELLSTSDIFLI